MWRCSWLLIAGLAASLPAYADTACVSNEKSDTVSLIEPCKLPVVKTIRNVAAIDIGRCTGLGQVQLGERPGDVFIAAP
jgi:hypothetical protein